MTVDEEVLDTPAGAKPTMIGHTYRVNLQNQTIPNELAEVLAYQDGFLYLHFLKRTTPGTTAGWINTSQITTMYEVAAIQRPAPRIAPVPSPDSGERAGEAIDEVA